MEILKTQGATQGASKIPLKSDPKTEKPPVDFTTLLNQTHDDKMFKTHEPYGFKSSGPQVEQENRGGIVV